MKNISPALLSFLQSNRQFIESDLFIITPGGFQNLIQQSQNFEDNAWSKIANGASGPPVVTPNFLANPVSGAIDAAKVAFPAASAGQSPYLSLPSNPQFSFAPGQVFTASFWAKTDTTALLEVYFQDTSVNQVVGFFNITNTWQRFTLTGTLAGGAGLGRMQLSIVMFSNGNIGGGQGAFNLYLWGVQLEMRPSAGPYLRTLARPAYGTLGPLPAPIFVTSSDVDITWNGNTYLSSSSGVKVTRKGLKWSVGLTVDTLDMYIDAPSLAPQLVGGYLDGARVQLDRLYGTSFGQWIDSLTLFAGNVGDIKSLGRTRCELEVRSRIELLNNSLPRILYQPSCRWALFDDGCTLDKATNGSVGTISSGSTAQVLNTNFTAATGYGDLGTVTFLTGKNAGQSATIKTWVQPGSAAVITLLLPLPFVPQAGDTVQVFPGCDKTFATCVSKFGNGINFGGFPYVPVAEAAL